MRKRLAAASALAALCLALGVHAQQAPQPPVATFRAGVDVVQLDVSVLDKNRKPVRGLTAKDFTIVEDGKPRPIVAFAAVDLPAADPSLAAWAGSVAPDVIDNTSTGQGRLVVIVMDRSIPSGRPLLTARQSAAAVINELGPSDLAAVIYTGQGTPQDFTSDRIRLLRAVNGTSFSGDPSQAANDVEAQMVAGIAEDTGVTLPVVNNTGACYCGLCVLETITHLADSVRDVTGRRKTMFFIGSSLTIQSADVECGFRLSDARTSMLRALDVSNMTVSVMDPTGLESVAPDASAAMPVRGRGAPPPIMRDNTSRQSNLGALPDHTGGRTVLNTNSPESTVRAIFEESDSYYLLGFQPGNPDDPKKAAAFHKVDVKVNRSGVDVRTRRGYYSPTATPPVVAATRTPTSPMAQTITSVVPQTEIPLSVTVAAFAVPGKLEAALAVVLGVAEGRVDPTSVPSTEGAEPAAIRAEHVQLLTGVFDRRGAAVGTHHQEVEVSWPGARVGDLRYDVISRLDLKPGSYELRIGAQNTTSARSGSVYTYVDVPAFGTAPVSLSGLVFEATSALSRTSSNAVADLIPVVPTARREFAQTDRAAAFLRAYLGNGQGPETSVLLETQVIDAANSVMASYKATVPAGAFGATHTVDYRYDLPLARLTSGTYLLVIQATLGKTVDRRTAKFVVR